MQKRVGVLRGGVGKNYHSSIKKGGEIISHILKYLAQKWKPIDIFVDKEGKWHLNGVPVSPADLGHRVDIVWNTAHPEHGALLKQLSIPCISSGYFQKALEESRDMLRRHMQKIGIPMPRSLVVPVYQEDFDGSKEEYAVKKAQEIHSKFGAPWIVKSFNQDKNMGIHLAKTFPELIDAIDDGVKHGDSMLVEEFISGKIASCHSVPKWRKEDVYVFPLGNSFGVFSHPEKEELISLTKKIYTHLGSPDYLKTDFVLSERGKIFLLQAEFMPDVKPGSHLQEVCESVGAKINDVIEHILENAN